MEICAFLVTLIAPNVKDMPLTALPVNQDSTLMVQSAPIVQETVLIVLHLGPVWSVRKDLSVLQLMALINAEDVLVVVPLAVLIILLTVLIVLKISSFKMALALDVLRSVKNVS